MDPAAAIRTNNTSAKVRLPFLTQIIATGFYSGYIPWASGTFGSIVGFLLYLIPDMEQPWIMSIAIVAGFFAGVITSAKVVAVVGHQLSATAELAKNMLQGSEHETPDPSIVVIDEIVGLWISLWFLPKSFFIILLAFIFFRVFDILKPPPARQFERYPNGWGIMLDDVMAGIYANLAVRLVMFVFPTIF
jgi:phosphatidylglycerophosphatase A